MTANWPETNAAGDLGDGRPATATERPESIEALGECVARRAAEGLAIYPQGGRTALDYGGIPRRPGVAVETTALNRVVDYPAADMTITVEAGITLQQLQATLAEQGQCLTLDPPQADRATLGGIFATNASGPRRYGLGRPRDLILGVTFINAEGKAVKGGGRVVKNVAGYDFPRLLTGSLGTLGVIAQMTLKVRPKPGASALAWLALESAEAAADALERLNTSATRPVALELLNGAAAGQASEALGLPGAAWAVVVGFEDNADAVSWQTETIGKEFPGVPIEVRRDAEADPLWSALIEFPARGSGPLALTANLRPSGVVPFCSRLDPALWAVQAHAGNGIVRARMIGDAALYEKAAAQVAPLRAEAVAHGGNLILSRCPTADKERLGVWGEPRGDWPLMEQVHSALDPGGVLNPGRFVGTI